MAARHARLYYENKNDNGRSKRVLYSSIVFLVPLGLPS